MSSKHTNPFGADEGERFILYPIKHVGLWDFKEKCEASLWTAKEVDFTKDVNQFAQLTTTEKTVIKKILGFFAASDGIVNENIMTRLYDEIPIIEARAFMSFQGFIESVHQQVYSDMLRMYIPDRTERDMLFHSIVNDACTREKAEWAMRWKLSDQSLAVRLFAQACVEGVFFASSFAIICWFKKKAALPGLTQSNDWILRDETTHWMFYALVYNLILPQFKPHDTFLQSIMKEVVDIESSFVRSLFVDSLPGLNADLMIRYVKSVANMVCDSFRVPPPFPDATNPFDFMDMVAISKNSYANFFEQRPTEYQRFEIKEFGFTSDF